MRNLQIYQASLRTRSNQLGSTLSKELRNKYGKRSVRIVKGDTVKVLRGEYKDVDGKVSKVSTEKNSIAIEGIKKEKGQGDKFDVYIHSTNVMVTDLNTEDSWRIQKIEGKQKSSIKKSKEKSKEVKPIKDENKAEDKSSEPRSEVKTESKDTETIKKEQKLPEKIEPKEKKEKEN